MTGLSDGVILTDSELRVTEANAMVASLLNRDGDLNGTSVFDLISGYHCSLDSRLILSEVQRGGCLFQMVERGDRRRVLNVRIMPFLGHGDGNRGQIVVIRDATESSRLKDMKTDFITRVAHKLRTPLTVIEGNLPLLHAAIPEKSEDETALRDVEKSALALCELVDSFVEFMEMEAESARGLLSTTALSPKDVLRRAMNGIKAHARRKHMLLSDKVPEDTPHVCADEKRLTEALSKLLDNAIKFSPEGSILTISAEAENTILRLNFDDEGPGIPTDEQKAVFQVFHQVDEESTGEIPGVGLGLSIARQIVQELGGDVQISSPHGFPDHGSRVTVLLPIYEPGRGRRKVKSNDDIENQTVRQRVQPAFP